MGSDKKQDGMLSRWSRRKLDRSTVDDDSKQSSAGTPPRDEEREAVLIANREAAEAVDLTEIDKDSDLSVFMKEGVPELLKHRALAALWRSNPVFSNVDGLVDYDEDFANPDLIMKTFQSAYQAGRGYLKEITENEAATESVAETAQPEVDPELAETVEAEEIREMEALEDGGSDASAVASDSSPVENSNEEMGEEEISKVSLRRRLMLDHPG